MRIPRTIAALVALGLMLASACTVCARPRYYQETGRPCVSCHTDPAGGDRLTAEGHDYKLHMHASLISAPAVPSHESSKAIAPDTTAEDADPDGVSDGDKAGFLAFGFGLTSLCILAYRRSR